MSVFSPHQFERCLGLMEEVCVCYGEDKICVCLCCGESKCVCVKVVARVCVCVHV